MLKRPIQDAIVGELAEDTIVRLADGRLAYVDRDESATAHVRLGTTRSELTLPADTVVEVVLTPRQLAQLYVVSPAIRRVAALVLSLCDAAREAAEVESGETREANMEGLA